MVFKMEIVIGTWVDLVSLGKVSQLLEGLSIPVSMWLYFQNLGLHIEARRMTLWFGWPKTLAFQHCATSQFVIAIQARILNLRVCRKKTKTLNPKP